MSTVDIGELSVRFEADISKLDSRLKEVEKLIGKTEEKMNDGAKAGKAFATQLIKAFAIDRAARAFVNALVESFQSMVQLNREAQRLGVSIEEMSRLEFAARSTGVSIETLSQSFDKLGQAGRKVTDTTIALKNMGIALKDASTGKLTEIPELLEKISARFASMPSGIEKTALATQLFGKEGDKLIPFLNLGPAGIKKLGDEAERLGIVLGTDTAKKVDDAQQTFNRLGAAWDALARSAVLNILPTLERVAALIEKMNSLGLSGALQSMFSGLTVEQQRLMSEFAADLERMNITGMEATQMLDRFATELKRLRASDIANLGTAGVQAMGQITEATKLGALTLERYNELKALGKTVTEQNLSPTEQLTKRVTDYHAALGQGLITHQTYFTALRQLAIDQRDANLSLAESLGVVLTAQEKQLQLEAKISEARAEGRISSDQYGRAMQEMGITGTKNMQTLASQVSSTLTTVFSKSKGAAIAAALINTAQGVTKTFAEYGGTPMGWSMAALIAASGAAQIAAIRSTNVSGSGGGASSVSASGGGAGAGGTPASGGNDRTLFVQGIDPRGLFTGEAVRDIAKALIDFQRDGGRVVLDPR